MKKYLAVFLIALMAVSVVSATGVVTAARPPPQPQTITITYEAGKTYTFLPGQFNYQYTSKEFNGVGRPPQGQVVAKAGRASASATVTTDTATAHAEAVTGVVASITSADPTNIPLTGNELVTVTINGRYTISASGVGESHAYTTAGWSDEVTGASTPAMKSGTIDNSATTSLASAFIPIDGSYLGYAVGVSDVFVDGIGQASASINISSITIEFPTSPPPP